MTCKSQYEDDVRSMKITHQPVPDGVMRLNKQLGEYTSLAVVYLYAFVEGMGNKSDSRWCRAMLPLITVMSALHASSRPKPR